MKLRSSLARSLVRLFLGIDTSVCLLNYKADGTPFWNQFFVAALRDAEGEVVNFVGVQCEVSKATVESQFASR